MKFDVPAVIINKLFEEGFEEQVLDIVMSCENRENTEVSDIPLSPTLMSDSGDRVILSPKVYSIYTELVDRISNSLTAQEIPFLLVGNRKDIAGEDFVVIEDIIYDMKNALSEIHVSCDEETFRKLMANNQYSVVSIGHTHGNVSEEKKLKTLARTLPEELRSKYDIRDTGLNISVADIWQHEAFKQIAQKLAPTKEILQTVIMYNGDMIMISPNGITKSNKIQTILQDGRYQVIPSGMTEQYTNKQTR